MILFQLATDDLSAIRGELGLYEPSDISALSPFHAICRPLTSSRGLGFAEVKVRRQNGNATMSMRVLQ